MLGWHQDMSQEFPIIEGAYFKDIVDQPRSLFTVGRGSSLAAAGAGALTVKEPDRFHAEGMGGAAFRHGPMKCSTPACSFWFSAAIPGAEAYLPPGGEYLDCHPSCSPLRRLTQSRHRFQCIAPYSYSRPSCYWSRSAAQPKMTLSASRGATSSRPMARSSNCAA